MSEVSLNSAMAIDQLFADSPDLFNDIVVHGIFLRIGWPKRTCGIVSGETTSGARKCSFRQINSSRFCAMGFA
jgi:hypothetical protein